MKGPILTLVVLLLFFGCSKKGTKPPDDGLGKREWFQEPCYSRADGFVYFRFVGEGEHLPGIYRFALADTLAPRLPEFLEKDGESPAISPCGNSLAFWRNYELWVRDMTTGTSQKVYYSPDSLLTTFDWLGCDTITYSVYPYMTISFLELNSRHATAWTFQGQHLTVSNDRRTWVFSSGPLNEYMFILHDGDLDTFKTSQSTSLIYSPRVSSNGEDIAYAHLWDGPETPQGAPVYYTIELLHRPTGIVTTLVESKNGDSPTWVNDSTILYVSLASDHYHSLWLMDLSGSHRRMVLDPWIFFKKEGVP